MLLDRVQTQILATGVYYTRNLRYHINKIYSYTYKSFAPWGLDYPAYFTATYYRTKWFPTIKLHIQKNHTIATFDFSNGSTKCWGWLFIVLVITVQKFEGFDESNGLQPNLSQSTIDWAEDDCIFNVWWKGETFLWAGSLKVMRCSLFKY